MAFEFRCYGCGQMHKGMPRFGTDAPEAVKGIAEWERAARCQLTTNDCVIDGTWFFLRGTIEIPVAFEAEPLAWDVWVGLGRKAWRAWRQGRGRQPGGPPLEGWLTSRLPAYPDTMNLDCRLHPRGPGQRPLVEMLPSGHPLAREQRAGIVAGRVVQLHAQVVHGMAPALTS